MNTDTFIEIGKQHKICEDYIISGVKPVPFIILSDGCSSSKNTEMGARILCYLAKQYLDYRKNELNDLDYKKMGNWIIHNAEMSARQLGLDTTSLDATLIVSFLIDDMIKIYIYGDGCVVLQESSDIVIKTFEFSDNAPYYLSYLIDDYRFGLYRERNPHKKLISKYSITGEHNISDEYAYDEPVVIQVPATYNSILITSDGLESFITEDPANQRVLNAFEVIHGFLAFKNIKGEFLKRRLKRHMSDLQKLGIGHYDDLSIGAYINT